MPANGTQVSLSEFAISPATISVPLNGELAVSNAGSIEHNLTIQGTSVHTEGLKAGDAASLDLKKGANTKGVGNQPLTPKVLADGTRSSTSRRRSSTGGSRRARR